MLKKGADSEIYPWKTTRPIHLGNPHAALKGVGDVLKKKIQKQEQP
jgi:hypothetical protein